MSHAARRTGAVFAVSLHALAGAALLGYEPTRSALRVAAPIMVDFIASPAVAPRPEPRIRPAPKPRPPEPESQPVVAAPVEAALPAIAPPPAPILAPAPVEAAVVPLTAPIFTADYLDNPRPTYPALSRRLREEGRVILRVHVNAAGEADDVQVGSASGHERLDDAARDTVRTWRFIPAKRGAEPVAAWVLIPIAFSLTR